MTHSTNTKLTYSASTVITKEIEKTGVKNLSDDEIFNQKAETAEKDLLRPNEHSIQ